MRRLLFPFFVIFLLAKNFESWLRIAAEAFGPTVTIVLLFALNCGIGAFIYFGVETNKKLRQQFVTTENQLNTHQQFWDELNAEYPNHSVVRQARQLLERK